MNWESLENEDVKELIKQFYAYQSSLISTPLGRLNINNQPEFPVYHAKYNKEFKEVGTILSRNGFKVEKAQLPEAPTSSESHSFIQEFVNLNALHYCLVLDDQVVQPPKNLNSIVNFFVQTLPTPWH